jgi:hypothetical protein
MNSITGFISFKPLIEDIMSFVYFIVTNIYYSFSVHVLAFYDFFTIVTDEIYGLKHVSKSFRLRALSAEDLDFHALVETTLSQR